MTEQSKIDAEFDDMNEDEQRAAEVDAYITDYYEGALEDSPKPGSNSEPDTQGEKM